MRSAIRLTLTMTLAAAALAPLTAETPRNVRLTGTDSLSFSLPAITAKPGELLNIVLRTMSMQPANQPAHNFVLLKPTAKIDAFITAAAMARNEGHLPAKLKDQIIIASGMASNGETTSATFRAPSQPGKYPYVCSFPGHYNGGMKGVLIVQP